MKRSELKRKTPLRSHCSLKTKQSNKHKSPIKHTRSASARRREFSPEIKRIVRERSFGRCEYCGRYPISEIHHAGIFRSHLTRDQGSGGLQNAIGLCVFCNAMVHGGTEGQKYRVLFAERAKQLAVGHSTNA